MSPKKFVATLGFALVAVATLTISPAHAGKTPSQQLADSWNTHYYFPFLKNLSRVPQIRPRSYEEQVRCDRFYAKVKARGEMKIVMGIGYYDFSEGEPFSFNGHDFGMNATIDNTYDYLYRKVLTRGCKGKLELCEFKEVARGVYVKTVKTPEGQKIRATIEVQDSSVTPEHQLNVGPYKPQQDAKSQATTEWFFRNVSYADLIVYNGHSRKGGGPDFHPPKLLPNLHVNYSWYERKTPGLTRLLTALQGPQRPAAVLMMSCNSVKLFEKKMARTAPEVGFAGTNAIIPGDIPNKGAMAGMNAFLKFQCNEGFQQEMQLEHDLLMQIKPVTIR